MKSLVQRMQALKLSGVMRWSLRTTKERHSHTLKNAWGKLRVEGEREIEPLVKRRKGGEERDGGSGGETTGRGDEGDKRGRERREGTIVKRNGKNRQVKEE